MLLRSLPELWQQTNRPYGHMFIQTSCWDGERQTHRVLISNLISMWQSSWMLPWPHHGPSCCSLLKPDSFSFFLIKRHLYHGASRRKLPQTLVCCVTQRHGGLEPNAFILCSQFSKLLFSLEWLPLSPSAEYTEIWFDPRMWYVSWHYRNVVAGLPGLVLQFTV